MTRAELVAPVLVALLAACSLMDKDTIKLGSETLAIPNDMITQRPERGTQGYDDSPGYEISLALASLPPSSPLARVVGVKDRDKFTAFEILPRRLVGADLTQQTQNLVPTGVSSPDGPVQKYVLRDGSEIELYIASGDRGYMFCHPTFHIPPQCQRTFYNGDVAVIYRIDEPDFVAIHAADQAIIALLNEWRAAARKN